MGLLHAYQQDQDERWKNSGATKDGACFALAIMWIIKCANKEDFWGWLEKRELVPNKADPIVEAVIRMMEQQQKASDVGGTENENGLPRGLLYKMAWVRHKIEGNAPSLEFEGTYQAAVKSSQEVKEKMAGLPISPSDAKQPGRYFNFINLNLKVGGAHAIATRYERLEKGTNSIYVFDANCGEYEFPELKNYLEYKKVLDYYDPRMMYILTFRET